MNWCILQKSNDDDISILLFYKIILICMRLSGFLFEMARNGYVPIHYSFAMFPDCHTEPRQSLLIVSS